MDGVHFGDFLSQEVGSDNDVISVVRDEINDGQLEIAKMGLIQSNSHRNSNGSLSEVQRKAVFEARSRSKINARLEEESRTGILSNSSPFKSNQLLLLLVLAVIIVLGVVYIILRP